MTLKEYIDKNLSLKEQIETVHLDCGNEKITSLNGIKFLPNLVRLDLYNKRIWYNKNYKIIHHSYIKNRLLEGEIIYYRKIKIAF